MPQPRARGWCRTKRPAPNRRSPIRSRALLDSILLNPIDPRTKNDRSQMRMTPSGAGKLHPSNGLGRPTSRDRRKKKHRETANSQRMQISPVKNQRVREQRYHLILQSTTRPLEMGSQEFQKITGVAGNLVSCSTRTLWTTRSDPIVMIGSRDGIPSEGPSRKLPLEAVPPLNCLFEALPPFSIDQRVVQGWGWRSTICNSWRPMIIIRESRVLLPMPPSPVSQTPSAQQIKDFRRADHRI